MKSIVHEASSIAKAIEQGLAKAGNPRDFAVKILEYPEKNFFGMTTKPARIALYVDERSRKVHEPHGMPGVERQGRESSERGERSREFRSHRSERSERSSHSADGRRERGDRHERRSARSESPRSERSYGEAEAVKASEHDTMLSERRREPAERVMRNEDVEALLRSRRSEEQLTPRWNGDTVRHAKDWLTRVLTEMHKLMPFTIEHEGLQLRIVLDRALFTDPEHERRVLASLSLLLLESCKQACRLNLRGHKVVLSHKAESC